MNVNRVLRRRWICLVFSVLSTVVAGCSEFHTVDSVATLKPSNKAVVGEIKLVDGDIGQWTRGILVEVCLAFAYPTPAKGLEHDLTTYGGQCLKQHVSAPEENAVSVANRFGREGGVFTAEVRNEDLYVLAIKTTTTILLATAQLTFPLWIHVRPSANRCEYIGTFLVHRNGPRIEVTVEDEFDRKKSGYAALVRGCDLQRSLGYRSTDDEIKALNQQARAVGDANAEPPRAF